jgi:hypothetical protein
MRRRVEENVVEHVEKEEENIERGSPQYIL